MHKKMRGWTKVVAGLLAAVLIGGMGAAVLAQEGGGSEEEICREAFEKCFGDAMKPSFFVNLLSLFGKVTSCLMGYQFCEQFVIRFSSELSR